MVSRGFGSSLKYILQRELTLQMSKTELCWVRSGICSESNPGLERRTQQWAEGVKNRKTTSEKQIQNTVKKRKGFLTYRKKQTLGHQHHMSRAR